MLKVNNKDTRTTPAVVLVSLLLVLTYFTPCSSVSIVNPEHVNVDWDPSNCHASRIITAQNKIRF